MSLAVAAKNIVIKKDTTVVAEITSLSGIAMSRGMEDVTSFSEGLARDRIPILEDPIDITMEMNFLNTNFIAFRNDYLTAAKSDYSIELPDDTTSTSLGTFTFTAYVSKLELMSEFDGVVQASCVLSVDDSGVVYNPPT